MITYRNRIILIQIIKIQMEKILTINKKNKIIKIIIFHKIQTKCHFIMKVRIKIFRIHKIKKLIPNKNKEMQIIIIQPMIKI